MLFSKMSFRQFFTGRPGRRRAGYSVVAEVQPLQTKVLPSAVPAVPIETEDAEYESTDVYMSEYADEYMHETEGATAEPMSDSTMPGSDSSDSTMPGSDSSDSTMPGSDGPDAWFNYVQTSTSGGVITVSGMISSSTGDYSSLSLSFEGSFTGFTATIASDGSFSASIPVGSPGLTGYVVLMQTENGEESQIDLHAVYI